METTAGEGIDDFIVIFQVPPGINLLLKPETSSNPPNLVRAIKIDDVPSENQRRAYKISLLNRGESITFAYLGYAASLIPAEPIKAFIHKKDWSQRSIERIQQLKAPQKQSGDLIFMLAVTSVGSTVAFALILAAYIVREFNIARFFKTRSLAQRHRRRWPDS